VGSNIRKISNHSSSKGLRNNSDLNFSMIINDSRKNLENKHDNILSCFLSNSKAESTDELLGHISSSSTLNYTDLLFLNFSTI
jgi:hypothetical protein